MKVKYRPEARRVRIEIIPILDCMFFLLVFFVYTMLSMTVQRGVSVNLPSAGSAARTDQQAITVTVTAAGELQVEGEPATSDTLGLLLDRHLANLDEPRVVINADEASQTGLVVRVLDVLKTKGVSKVVVLSTPGEPR